LRIEHGGGRGAMIELQTNKQIEQSVRLSKK
jgi:hypothetical protein